MASVFSAARNAIYPLIETHFAVSTIFNVITAERVNVKFLIEQAEQSAATINLPLPYAVVAWGPATPGDYACNSEDYEQEASVFYIASTRNGSSGISDRALYTAAEDLALAFTDAVRGSTSIDVIETSVDLSHTNEGNTFFMMNNLPMFCIAVRVRLLVGIAVN